jgi:hypothetical protein
MPTRDYLLEQAEKCRRLAAATIDEKVARTLRGMASEYEADAAQLAEERPEPRPGIS